MEDEVTVTNGRIIGNRANVDGGIASMANTAAPGVLILKNVVIRDNRAGRYGAGLFVAGTMPLP